MPDQEHHGKWHCPHCAHEWDLSKSEDREFAILDMLQHALGMHCTIDEVIEPEP